MEYPALNPNAKLFKIYEKALSPYYDIVWSFDYYATSIPVNSQLGICLFLQDSQGIALSQGYSILTSTDSLSYLAYPDDTYFFSYQLSAGNNVDLGYAGSLGNIDLGVIGVGLDTTGSFALSVSSLGVLVRDGELDSRRKLNSISVRGQAPAYSWKEYSINTSLSTYNFNIL